MGFWSDLKNAAPHKGVARGRELHAARISSIVHESDVSPSDLVNAGIKQCEVCRVIFGAALSRDSYPCVVKISVFDHLSFGEHLPVVIACNKCVETFGLETARLRTEKEVAEVMAEKEVGEEELPDKMVIPCANPVCDQSLRVPSDKAGYVKCPSCDMRFLHSPDTPKGSPKNMPTNPVPGGRCTYCGQRLNIFSGEKSITCPKCDHSWMHP